MEYIIVALYYISVAWMVKYPYRGPSMNDQDHLVGLQTNVDVALVTTTSRAGGETGLVFKCWSFC